MLYFHFCQKYINKVSQETDKVIRNRIANLVPRTSLKGVSGIFSYSGVSVLQTAKPSPMRTIIQEKKVISKNIEISVFFVQDIVAIQDLQPYTEVRKGLWALYYPITKEDEQGFINDYEQESIKSESDSNPLPDNLKNWVNDYKMNVTYDIYESEEWVEYAMSDGLEDGMQSYDITSFNHTLQEMLRDKSSSRQLLKNSGRTRIETQQFHNFGIIYSRILLPNHTKPFFLLHNGAHLQNQQSRWEKIKQDVIQKYDITYNNIDDIGKKAVRAYPNWSLKHDDLWRSIQKNSESGNLSLLTEQTDFLNRFKFPAYINGQAGSGKSTMLNYLFANTYYYKCAGEIEGDVIFLTENEKLLTSTKIAIRDLLQHNPEFSMSSDDITEVDKYFCTLKEFLLSLLEEEMDRSKFPEGKYLDFSVFKTKYEHDTHLPRQLKNKYTPEFVWFAITTYIIGYDLSENITSENYNEKMPRDGKELISKDVLKDIEKNVLPFYKKLIDQENYWDKLKIIRYIKEYVGLNRKFEVIFCDEAQDFSRIELKFIFSLSEYLQYDLTPLDRIPIVFAGDPLQTVNPTGFRKAEVKDLFYGELGVKLNDNEYKPKHNYRSSQAIVNIANAIQYFRKRVFDASISSPQQTKQPDSIRDAFLNTFLSYEMLNTNPEHYVEQLQYKAFILPVNPAEKNDYVEKQGFLKEFVHFYSVKEDINGDAKDVNEAILKSSVEAKGIDYPQVVIYGFGTYCIEHFGLYNELVQNSYENRFFFNKLYVAITRAQEELIIIDSKDSLEYFWQPLLQDYANSAWQSDSGISKEDILKTICFTEQDITIKKGTPDMALENARREKEQAEKENNSTLIRMAGSQFLRLGNKKEYFICKAIEAKMDGDYKSAAEYYKNKNVGNEGLELAATAYWEGKLLEDLQKLGFSIKDDTQSLRLVIVNLNLTGIIQPRDIRLLEEKRVKLEEILRKINWKSDIINKFIQFSQKLTNREQQILLINIFTEINTPEDKKLTYEIGRLQYRLGRYSEAVDTWLDIDGINDDILYINALSEKAKQEEKYDLYIECLGKLSEKYKNVIEQEEIEQKIISTFESFRNEIILSDNLFTHIYVFGAYLLHKRDIPFMLELVQRAEEKANTRKEFIRDYYFDLLKSNRLPAILFDFILERWAKYQYLLNISVNVINASYKEIVTDTNVNYIPFSVQDLDKIEIVPNFIIPELSDHIETITINNFRKFTDVNIENLGLFNLVVGDNNIGKTSLLEAFLFTSDKKEYLRRLAFAFIERKNIQPDKKEINGFLQLTYVMDETFLNDFKSYSSSEFKLGFAFKQKRHSWQYKILQSLNETLDPAIQYMIFGEDDYKGLNNITLLEAMKNPLMPYGKGFGMDLAAVYEDEIASDIPTENEFIKKMELFIPNIFGIRANSRKGEINILEKNSKSYISLHQYGEGANKIFRILLLLALHKGRRLMIDEIDAGIHYSRFNQFWKIILKVAKEDNTQIIATTHNDECISYFIEALKDLEGDGLGYEEQARVVQCKTVGDQLKIRSYDFENFNLAEERGIELRGGQKL